MFIYQNNSLQDIKQNHWTMKYGSQPSTFIWRSNVGSHGLIISKYDVHTSYGLQDIRHMYFEVKCRVTQTHNPKI